MIRIVATLVIVTSDFFLENDPKTWPMIKTMQAMNNRQKNTGIAKNILKVLFVKKS